MNLKKIFIYIASLIVFLAAGCYSLFLFVLPPVLNSPGMVGKYENFLTEKSGNPVRIKSFNFSSRPNLSVEIKAESIYSKDKNEYDIINIKNLDFTSKPFSIKPEMLDAKSVYIDYSILKSYLKTEKKTTSTSFNLNYLPLINISKVFVKLDKNSNISLENIQSYKDGKKIRCLFSGLVNIPYTKSPVILGKDGSIYYYKELYFDDFSIKLDNSKLFLDGSLDNLKISGKGLPVSELEAAFLYFYKLKHPNKKNFIENFQNFSGTLDINLLRTKDGLNGNCTANNLRALFWTFKIPVELPVTVFKFDKKEITAKTNGRFGSEPVYTDFNLQGLMTKSLVVRGNVRTKLSNNFTKKYFPLVSIKGAADASVKYKTQNKKVDIDYILTMKKGTNLISKYGNLDCTGNDRRISAHTLKDGNKIYLKKYSYEFLSGQGNKLLLSGDGLFEKLNGNYKPAFLTLKTNGQVPVSLIQSFTRDFIKNGTFSSDIKYVFLTKTLTGFFNLYNISHSDFLFLKETNLNITGNDLKLTSSGTFFDSPITMNVSADNNFEKNILIHYIDIHLNKFLVKRGEYSSLSAAAKQRTSSNKAKDYNIIVEKGRIQVDDILHKKFSLHDVEIWGTLKNNVVDFIIPQTIYSKGILSAKGLYNVKTHCSDINFYASDIDSDEVVTKIFNLPNQVQGLAYATLHLKTQNKLNDIKAHATFAITDGYLPKIGSEEFILKKPEKMKKFKFLNFDKIKFTLSKITNLDFSNKKTFTSNIRGSFNLNNNDVDDIKIFSQSDYLSLFIEGHYNIDSQFAHLYVWGRHNKTEEKKIRILKLPFTFLYRLIFRVERSKEFYADKLEMIPSIKLKAGDIESVFRVFVNGNLNTDNFKVIMKDLR